MLQRMNGVCLKVVNSDVANLIEGQKQLESEFEDVLARKAAGDMSKSTGNLARNGGPTSAGRRSTSAKKDDILQHSGNGDVQAAAANLRNNAAIFAWSLKQNPLASDNLDKVQTDRYDTTGNHCALVAYMN